MPSFLSIVLMLSLLLSSAVAFARLEVCNQSDLVLMVTVGYDTDEGRVATEGWWRIYPGFCEVPVDVSLLKGSYYVHAESNPRSTMPVDAFSWGDEKKLCVQTADFRLPNANFCGDNDVVISFNQIDKNWRNYNKIDIEYGKRRYLNQFRVRVAGIQRLLSMLGYDVGEIDGVAGEKTVIALNEIGLANNIFGFDFKKVYPILERLIAQKQNLDN